MEEADTTRKSFLSDPDNALFWHVLANMLNAVVLTLSSTESRPSAPIKLAFCSWTSETAPIREFVYKVMKVNNLWTSPSLLCTA